MSLFPIKEAARAKVSVSVLLLLGVALGAYYLGSQRHDEQLRALKAEVAGIKTSVENCAKSK